MGFLRDLRHGFRTLRRVPGLVGIAVVTLALGIGANTAIFSVIYSVLLKPLAFPDAHRIVQVWMAFPERNIEQTSWSHANFWDARDMAATFEDIGAIEFGSLNLTGLGDPERIDAFRVNAGFFRVLGVAPVAGRLLLAGDDEPGRDQNVVILTHRFWTRRFGGNPEIVGRTVTLDGVPHQVIGVLPAATPYLDWADVFRPLIRTVKAQRGSWELFAVGRLKPGVTLESARADLRRVAGVLAQQYPEVNKGMSATASPLGQLVAGDNTRRALWVLLGAVGVLLLIACVNLTNLLLAKAAGRTREIAIRSALGANRRRVVGLLVAESLLLSLAGAAVGLLLSVWTIDLLRASSASGISRLDEVEINGWVLTFTTVVAVWTGILTGLMPAVHASRGDLVPALREGERGIAGTPRQQRLRSALVGAEVALTLTLLVGAGLLLRSFSTLLQADRGFQTERRVLVEVNLPRPYSADEGKRADQFLLDFESRLRRLSPVLSVGSVSGRPLGPGSTGMGIVSAERQEGSEVPWASWRLITKDYFKTMGVPLLRGRTFDERDLIARPWRIIVSQRLADRLWPGEDPVGRQAVLWKGQGNEQAEVIGVVGNMRERGLAQPPTLAVYLPAYGSGPDHMFFAMHTTASAEALVPMVRAALSNIDPSLPLSNVQTLEEIVSASTASTRFIVGLLSGFAGLAMVLALVGIFGVTSYSVSRQTAEIGVRLALGASHDRLLRFILRQAMMPVALGIAVGVGLALLVSRLIAGLLFEVSPHDPMTYVVVVGLLAGTALLACLLPARQALRIDVVSALRAE
ncbi:MAG: ABC transporter permease [Vicinamibacterales bacterium]